MLRVFCIGLDSAGRSCERSYPVVARVALDHRPRDLARIIGEDSERGPDEDLRLQFEAMGQLSPEEKGVARAVLEGLLLKHAAQRFTPQAGKA